MAMQRPPAHKTAKPANQQVFKPRETVQKFSKIFPALYAIFGAIFLVALVAGIWLGYYLVPIMVAFPIFGTIAAGVYASRLAQSVIVIDGDRLRIVQGKAVKANLLWHQITRLTIRKEREEDLYEMWVKDQSVPLPASFYQDGDKLIKAVSARTSLAWERVS